MSGGLAKLGTRLHSMLLRERPMIDARLLLLGLIAGLALFSVSPRTHASGLPDLVVDSIVTDPTAPAPLQGAAVTVTIRNQAGDCATDCFGFMVDFYQDLPSAPGPFWVGDASCFFSGLAAGATDVCTDTVIYATGGTFQMWAQVDTDQQMAESVESNNVFGPQSINVGSGSGADSDGDGVPDASDNCPAWPNPSQNLPPWPVPAGDPDCDGFTTAAENSIGTSATRHCAVTSTANDEAPPDAWPADFDDSQKENVFDVLALKPLFGTTAPPTSPRYDIFPDGKVDIFDVLALKPYWVNSCAP